ncbi:MAG: response regulator, partial [Alphaproteobacteria bacterium]|nr:response regulator [Alphaproteobacteria bacterium]
MRILVIEDDDTTAAYIQKGLSEQGYGVQRATDGRDGLFQATIGRFDALIVDRMLPGLDGLSVIQALRAAKVDTPALILSALAHLDDRVKGL